MDLNRICLRVFQVILMAGLFLYMIPPCLSAGEVQRISKEELKKMLDQPDLIILDVRIPSEWEQSAFKIKGAKRLEISAAEKGDFPYPKDKMIVLYCA